MRGMLASLAVLAGLAASAEAVPIKVFILSGQSNMQGVGKIQDLGPSLPNYPNIRFYGAQNGAASLTYLPALKPEGTGASPGQFGPEFGIAEKLTAKYPTSKMAFIKVSFGGTSLQGNWIDNQPAGTISIGVYTWFTSRVKEALALLQKDPAGYQICGVIWMQGETDASVLEYSLPGVYRKNLKNFVDNKIRGFLSPYPQSKIGGYLPFAYGQIHLYGKGPDGYPLANNWKYGSAIVLEQYYAQTLIKGVRCTPGPINAEVYPVMVDGDGYNVNHYDAAGLKKVGQSLGSALVQLIGGATSLGCPAPAKVNPSQLVLNLSD
jgi:hypothetical protein